MQMLLLTPSSVKGAWRPLAWGDLETPSFSGGGWVDLDALSQAGTKALLRLQKMRMTSESPTRCAQL